jgi:NadR type nicotinamide-nucleotide adenylyltransferase
MEGKKYKVGLVLGKFMPCHAGHIYLIRTALEQCDNVILLCCSLKCEPIDGRLRYTWLLENFWKEVSEKKLLLDHIEEELPQFPYVRPNFWHTWERLITEHLHGLPKIDAFFTSETYGDKLAEVFKCAHVCVDIKRSTYPVSGTKVRENPIENINYVGSNIGFYYAKKIVFAGPESVGKSTYSAKMAKDLDFGHVEEYGRTHYEKLLEEKKPFTLQDIGLIAGGQLSLEQSRFEESGKTGLVCDTDIVATEIFSYFFFQTCPQWIKQHNRRTDYTLTLLLTPEVDLVQDGTRTWSDRWLHFNLLEDFYRSSNRAYTVISGSNHEERYKQCLEWVKQVL